MSDLISRQAAIDAIKTWGLIDGLSEGQAIEILADEEKLPTAQPEILACGKGELNVPGTNVGDMISRQAAIDVLHGYFDGMLETDTVCPKDLYNLFEIIPSAEPEPDKRLEKIADLVDGTIDHFDKDDAMDLLYQIKEVLNKR